jgi:molybdopterin synthase catalytic subunit
MAEREMATVLAEAEKLHAGVVLVAEHRIGTLAVGEASIVIAAAHAHRGPAIDALRYAIDEIKNRAPIWKRELYADGSESWVDPTQTAAT